MKSLRACLAFRRRVFLLLVLKMNPRVATLEVLAYKKVISTFASRLLFFSG